MTNRYYNHSSGAPVAVNRGTSGTMRAEFDAVVTGFATVQTEMDLRPPFPGGILPITSGGTGAATLPSGILKGAGTGAISAAAAGTDFVAPGSVTTSALTMNTSKLLGRSTASSGAVEEIIIGSNLTLTGGTLDATGNIGSSSDVTNETNGKTIGCDLLAYSSRVAKAWIAFNGSGGVSTIASVGCTASRTGTGAYTITLTNARPNVNYAVFSSSNRGPGTAIIGAAPGSTSNFSLTTYNTSFSATDAEYICVMVFDNDGGG